MQVDQHSLRSAQPFVSVILPTHNRHDLVGRAIRSILSQTYQSWELIVIDDGSTDRTAAALSEFARDPRIRVIRLNPGRGGAAARNEGLNVATGDLVAFLDDDDAWLPDKLAKQVAFLDRRPDVDIVSCNFLRVGDTSSKIIRIDGEYTMLDLMSFNVLGSFSFCVVRRDAIGESRINETLRACQDWSLWLTVLLRRGSRGVSLEDVLVEYDDTSKPCLTKSWRRATRSHLIFLRDFWNLFTPEIRAYHLASIRLRRVLLGSRPTLAFAIRQAGVDACVALRSIRVLNFRRYMTTLLLFMREVTRPKDRCSSGGQSGNPTGVQSAISKPVPGKGA